VIINLIVVNKKNNEMKNYTLYCICTVLAVILLIGCRTTCPPHHPFKKRNIIDSIIREVGDTSLFISL